MALPPTLYDLQLTLSDPDRRVEVRSSLKLARHPSETSERLWLRLIAYFWRYDERLSFHPGLADADEPDLFSTDLTGRTTRWLRVGKADPAKVRRAVTQHSGATVSVLFESEARLASFVEEAAAGSVTHLEAVELGAVDQQLLRSLGRLETRRFKVGATLVGDHVYLDVNGESFDGPILAR